MQTDCAIISHRFSGVQRIWRVEKELESLVEQTRDSQSLLLVYKSHPMYLLQDLASKSRILSINGLGSPIHCGFTEGSAGVVSSVDRPPV